LAEYLDLADYLFAMLEFLARNRVEWTPPSVDETVATIEDVAAGKISERELADWLRAASE
jgi:prophage maintenance system killer protein